MARGPATDWAELTRPRAQAGYAAAVITALALWCLGRWDLVARLSLLELVLVFGLGNVITTVVRVWFPAPSYSWRVTAPVASVVLVTRPAAS